jgi:DNA-binding SARP family transcriptional activator
MLNHGMPTVEVRLLGPLEVGVSGRRLELRRQKQRALLALLALRAGEVVSTDRLVAELWGETPPKAAIGSLQNLVSELRKALGAEMLVTRAPGYVLALDREHVDAHRFELLLHAAQERGPAERRAETLREALSLWRGPPLADLEYERFAQAEIPRLEELRSSAREELFAAELELGRHARVLAELEAFVAEHPLRERPRGQLMLALYRSGRQADALEAYRRARETLVEELGIDPSEELHHLEQAILRHDPSLDLERPAAKEPEQPERRKTVTILFADVVDSSALAAELDPEVLRSLMRTYFDVVRTIVERHGGTVEKFIGDAAMAVFGIPEVHEDDALRAVRAALELHEAVATLQSGHDVALRIYAGVNTGEVLATDPASGESFATGSAVILATRFQQAAVAGETLIGETTRRLVEDGAVTEAVEPLDLGGGLGRTPAFRVLGLADEATGLRIRRTAPLVGRTDQLARLRAALAGVESERRSRVLTVLGEAGIGKTRLAVELASSTHAAVLVGRCSSYGEGATYLPLAEAIRQAVPRRVRASVASLLEGDEQADLVAQRIAELTGDAEGTGSTGELFWAVRRLLEALSREHPLLLVLEDVHWAEPTLLDLVEYLSDWVSEAPVLVLCLARPDLLDSRPGWAEGAVRLEPLSPDESMQLVAELADVPDDLRERVVAAAEGNALFVEQLLAYVLEDEGARTTDSLPPSVEALLASRLDRLESDERALLERAAVVGKEFPRTAVIHLSPPGALAGIDGHLSTLVRKGFIRTHRSEDDRYRFHHALVRDVAYAGVTKELRADLHERHAVWLERRDGALEIIGYHLEQAHRYRAELRPRDPALEALAQRAGSSLSSAGMRAFRHADAAAATNLLRRAAPLLVGDPSTQSEALCELGVAERALGELEHAAADFSAAARAADAIADRRLGLRARIELAHLSVLTDRDADLGELVALAREAIPLFEELGDDRALSRAWRHVGYVRGAMQGRCAEWLAASEQALEHYRRSGWSVSGCLSELAAALYYGPTPVSAGVDRCTQLLEETTDRSGRAHVLVYLAGLHALAEGFEEALDVLHEGETILRELGETYALANNSGRIRGAIHLLAGDPAHAERVFRDCCETFERAHDEAALSSVSSELARALCEQEQYAKARDWITLAEEHAPAGDMAAQTSWRAIAGRVHAASGDVERGHALALEALRFSEATDALTHRGEVLLDLADVLRARSRQAEAAARIEDALGLFATKENAASIRRARSQLAELAVA